MKETASTLQKASQNKASEANERTSAGPNGVTVAPPALQNRAGLPDGLKNGIESLSGLSMDDVRVHYNSSKPATLDALAYAKGTDIHLGPGQERHLPHEAWHVVQQKQGRVKPTLQMKGGVPVNDDWGLEHEADVMGAKALEQNDESSQTSAPTRVSKPTLQRMTARVRREHNREPTRQEIATARAQGRANSQRLTGHGRAAHGRRVNVPTGRQQQQTRDSIREAEEQAIQLKMRQKIHYPRPVYRITDGD